LTDFILPSVLVIGDFAAMGWLSPGYAGIDEASSPGRTGFRSPDKEASPALETNI
jgi:hypothetical protein